VTDERPGERPPDESAENRRHRQGLKFRRREDYALELFKEALADLTDVPRVDRILVELGRFYNPLVDAPIVDVPTRGRVMELLERARWDDARQLLEDRMSRYAPPTEGEGI
jgi:hypothetical protein